MSGDAGRQKQVLHNKNIPEPAMVKRRRFVGKAPGLASPALKPMPGSAELDLLQARSVVEAGLA